MLLEGKRLVVTGVLTDGSIAWHTARVAQEQGAEIVLTGFGRGKRLTERSAQRLESPPDVLELDINDPDHMEALAVDLEARWGAVDGALHAIAFAPDDALGGSFLTAPADSAATAFLTSAFSFKTLAVGLQPLMQRAGGGGIRAQRRRCPGRVIEAGGNSVVHRPGRRPRRRDPGMGIQRIGIGR